MRISTLIAALAVGATLSAQSITEPTGAWGNWLTGQTGQDQLTDVAIDPDNNVYWFGTMGTNESDTEVTYAGEHLFDGSPYAISSTTTSKNLTLLKTDADGKALWHVYSSAGDLLASYGGLAINQDGDIVFYCMARNVPPTDESMVVINDTYGTSITVTDPEEYSFYRMIVGTVTADGHLKWARAYGISHDPVEGATGSYANYTSQGLQTYGVTVDDNGNIYVSGSYSREMTFPINDDVSVSLKPHNIEGWTGDPQTTRGSLYIVKLDPDGYYLDSFVQSGGDIKLSTIQSIKWVDGQLYVYGALTGSNDGSVTIGGMEFTPNSYVCPIVGSLDSDFNVNWLKCYPGDAVDGKNAVQNVGMTIADGKIWLAGMYNGKISSPDDSELYVVSEQGTLREGFIIKLDAADGSWIASRNSRTDFTQTYLTGYLRVILPDSDTDKIYVYGYAMNSTVGVFLREYDKETLEGNPEGSWNILTGGGAPTCLTNVAYSPELCAVFVGARGNNAYTLLNGETTSNPGGYTMLLTRFDLPKQFETYIDSIIAEEGSAKLRIIGSNGVITVVNPTDVARTVTVYDLLGRAVANISVAAHASAATSLASGLYIANGRKILL